MDKILQDFIKNSKLTRGASHILHLFVEETLVDRLARFNTQELEDALHYTNGTTLAKIRELKQRGILERMDVGLGQYNYSPWVLTEKFRLTFGIPLRKKKLEIEIPSLQSQLNS